MPGAVDEGTDRGLNDQARDAADGHHRTDARGVPARFGQQVNPQEWTQPRLHVGEEEVHLVQGGQRPSLSGESARAPALGELVKL
ncbi:MAG: hypothetical protein WCF33_00455 [Pseudonocardiaceae bacterium]